MHARLPANTARPVPHPVARLGRLLILVLPLGLLLLAALRQGNPETPFLWLGVSGQAFACLLAVLASRMGREASSTVVILLYVVALGCLMAGSHGHSDWLAHVTRSVLLVIPVIFFALQCLRDSGR